MDCLSNTWIFDWAIWDFTWRRWCLAQDTCIDGISGVCSRVVLAWKDPECEPLGKLFCLSTEARRRIKVNKCDTCCPSSFPLKLINCKKLVASSKNCWRNQQEGSEKNGTFTLWTLDGYPEIMNSIDEESFSLFKPYLNHILYNHHLNHHFPFFLRLPRNFEEPPFLRHTHDGFPQGHRPSVTSQGDSWASQSGKGQATKKESTRQTPVSGWISMG